MRGAEERKKSEKGIINRLVYFPIRGIKSQFSWKASVGSQAVISQISQDAQKKPEKSRILQSATTTSLSYPALLQVTVWTSQLSVG